jgi:hypothetical protein
MRFFLFTISAISLLLLPACNFRSSTSEAEVAPVAPTPVPDSPPVAAADETMEQATPTPVSPSVDPELTFDPAPAPPSESSSFPPQETPSESSTSAEDVLNSVARVLQGAVEGSEDETGARSQGSVFGSIGRALSKGFQEATADANATDE